MRGYCELGLDELLLHHSSSTTKKLKEQRRRDQRKRSCCLPIRLPTSKKEKSRRDSAPKEESPAPLVSWDDLISISSSVDRPSTLATRSSSHTWSFDPSLSITSTPKSFLLQSYQLMRHAQLKSSSETLSISSLPTDRPSANLLLAIELYLSSSVDQLTRTELNEILQAIQTCLTDENDRQEMRDALARSLLDQRTDGRLVSELVMKFFGVYLVLLVAVVVVMRDQRILFK